MEVTNETVTEKCYANHECKKTIMAVYDAMDLLSGKWKISILAALCFNKKRFSDLLRDIPGISGKMLSRELKDMEFNRLVTRTVLPTQPVTVEYALTPHGQGFKEVIEKMAEWGLKHRREIIDHYESVQTIER